MIVTALPSSQARHDNRFRYYDPSVGRYVSADPIGQLGGINLYGYVENDPMNLVDPRGQIPILPAVAAVLSTPAGQALAAATVAAFATAVVGTFDLIQQQNAAAGAGQICLQSNDGGEADAPPDGDPARNPGQDKPLTPGEIKALEDGGENVHDLKAEREPARVICSRISRGTST